MEKTYDVKCGTVGILPDGKAIVFATDDEATEYIREQQEEDSDE